MTTPGCPLGAVSRPAGLGRPKETKIEDVPIAYLAGSSPRNRPATAVSGQAPRAEALKVAVGAWTARAVCPLIQMVGRHGPCASVCKTAASAAAALSGRVFS